MTLLPVVERELRVAARKRSTFWIRIAAALAALLIAGGFLLLEMVGPGFGRAGIGKGLFAVLTWLCLGAALSAGLFFTSDCLSEEKRDGTMGFLFLTDLRGYDVVLGKLLATSLRCFYALLAVLPILGLTLLMGGVTGGQFWRVSLALGNALFVSLAAGLFVSAVSRDSQRALAGTLLLTLILAFGGMLADSILSAAFSGFDPHLSLSSPGYVFAIADSWGATRFWPGLLVNVAIGCLLLGASCAVLPRTWQEKGRSAASRGKLAQWWVFGTSERLARLREMLINTNPIMWLACRERWQAVALWVLAGLSAAAVAAICATDQNSGWWFAWSYLSGFVTLLLYLGMTSQAGRFLVDARRSGLIEVLLATPMTGKLIVDGQWRALLRMFGPAFAVYIAAYFAGALNQQRAWAGAMNATSSAVATAMTNSASAAAASGPVATATSSVTITTGFTVTTSARTPVQVSLSGFSSLTWFLILAVSAGSTLTVAANLLALIWFGMLMGLTSRSANLATLKAIAFVQVIPWLVVSFASSFVMGLLVFSSGLVTGPKPMMFFPLILSGVTTLLSLGKDIAFYLWARKKLYSEFRERAFLTMATTHPIMIPPPLPVARII